MSMKLRSTAESFMRIGMQSALALQVSNHVSLPAIISGHRAAAYLQCCSLYATALMTVLMMAPALLCSALLCRPCSLGSFVSYSGESANHHSRYYFYVWPFMHSALHQRLTTPTKAAQYKGKRYKLSPFGARDVSFQPPCSETPFPVLGV